jgi:predicted nucleotidyltransferase
VNEEVKSLAKAIRKQLSGMEAKVLLFGSRARGDFDQASDYDVLVITSSEIDKKKQSILGHRVRQEMAKSLISVDILLKSQAEVEYFADVKETTIYNALLEGVEI